MTNKFIPAIGTAGYYELLEPFDVDIAAGERYTLKAVRAISDCIADNEDPKTDIYVEKGIENEYDADFKADIEILSLRSDRGHWVYVPITKVKCYPIVNGIPYRAASIVIPLRAIPVDTDFTTLFSRLNETVQNALGFTVTPQLVESSKTVLVSSDTHLAKSIERRNAMAQYTDAEQIARLNATITVMTAYIQELENYINTH